MLIYIWFEIYFCTLHDKWLINKICTPYIGSTRLPTYRKNHFNIEIINFKQY